MRTRTKKADQEQVKKWWKQYKENGDETARNRLLENYLRLVKYAAERICAKLPDEVDPDDMVSAGIFGLMDAVKAFDPDRGVKFETYCAPRIRGAILDGLTSSTRPPMPSKPSLAVSPPTRNWPRD